jgi:hypothetical protein
MERPFEAYRRRRLGELEAAFRAYLQRGFPTAEFAGQPEPETLQCRDETDQIRWLGLLMKAQGYVAAGAGALSIDPPIRCTSNREYAVSYAEALERMMALMGQYGAALKALWAFKDAIRAAPNREQLMLIDLNEGWP